MENSIEQLYMDTKDNRRWYYCFNDFDNIICTSVDNLNKRLEYPYIKIVGIRNIIPPYFDKWILYKMCIPTNIYVDKNKR